MGFDCLVFICVGFEGLFGGFECVFVLCVWDLRVWVVGVSVALFRGFLVDLSFVVVRLMILVLFCVMV